MHSLDVLLSQFGTVCCSVYSFNCCFLTCIQISQEAGKVVWYSHVFKNFPQSVVIYKVKGFGVVDKADVFWNSCFFCDSADTGNLISASLAFSQSSLNTWKFLVHVLLKPSLENFEHYFASMWDECNHEVVWTFFGIAFLWEWNENWPFSSPVTTVATKAHLVKTMVFPVVMYGCENQWTSEAAQSCLTLCDPMDCSLPASSIHRIFQARVLEWVVISFSRGSPQPRDQTQVSCLPGRHFTIWTTREAWVLELDYKESIALENWCFWTVVLEKTLESLLDSKIKPVNPKWNQSWMFIERTGAEAETPILWLPDENWLIGKDPDAGKYWRQEEKGMTEDEMVGWHHQLDGHEIE